MGISMYNASGYRDPTAFEAINRAESFRIDHSTGYIHVNMDTFFPCTVKKGQKFFQLVCQHCDREQQDWLMDALLRRAEKLKAAEEKSETRLAAAVQGTDQWREENARLRSLKSTQERLQRNIRDYEQQRRRRLR